MNENTVEINRAPVLTLWGVVVAERLGHEHETALTLGKALAGLNAQSKGRMIGIYGKPKAEYYRLPRKSTRKRFIASWTSNPTEHRRDAPHAVGGLGEQPVTKRQKATKSP